MMNPVAVSIIANTFTDPRERARAIGIWGGVFGLSIAAGPPLGGVLVNSVGWRGIFWVNVPIGLVPLILLTAHGSRRVGARIGPRRVDPVGQGLALVPPGHAHATRSSRARARAGPPRDREPDRGGRRGGRAASSPTSPAAASPLLELQLLPQRRRSPGYRRRSSPSAPCLALGGFLFLNTLYLQDVRGLSALSAGLYTLPLAVMTLLLAPLSGWIIGRWGPRLPLVVAGVAMTAGGLLLTSLAPDTSVARLMAAYVIFGIGIGMADAPITKIPPRPAKSSQRAWRRRSPDQPPRSGQSLGVAGGRGWSDIGHARPAARELRPGEPRRPADHRRRGGAGPAGRGHAPGGGGWGRWREPLRHQHRTS